jgi:hypothetical protein
MSKVKIEFSEYLSLLNTIKEQEKRILILESLAQNEPLFRVGDIVYDIVYGKGQVVEVSDDEEIEYPVSVLFEDGDDGDLYGNTETFTNDGCYYIGKKRTLYFEEIPIPESAKRRK